MDETPSPDVPGAPDPGPSEPSEPSGRSSTRRTLLGVLGVGAALVAIPQAGRLLDGEPTPDPELTLAAATPGAATPTVDYSARFAAFAPADEPNGDLAMVEWPDYTGEEGGDVRRLYEFQVLNGDLMRYMPCFCGCNAHDGHVNNRDCYIKAVNADGSVVFDAMAPT